MTGFGIYNYPTRALLHVCIISLSALGGVRLRLPSSISSSKIRTRRPNERLYAVFMCTRSLAFPCIMGAIRREHLMFSHDRSHSIPWLAARQSELERSKGITLFAYVEHFFISGHRPCGGCSMSLGGPYSAQLTSYFRIVAIRPFNTHHGQGSLTRRFG